MTTPTSEQMAALELALNHLRTTLFPDVDVPPVMLTFGRRAPRYLGCYIDAAWTDGEHRMPEISINANALSRYTPWDLYQTLGHELLHHLQSSLPDLYGKPSRDGYHNGKWIALAESVGYEVQGQGQTVHTTARPDTPIMHALRTMPLEAVLPWTADGETDETEPDPQQPGTEPGQQPAPGDPKPRPAAKGGRTRYVCLTCGCKAWGRPGLHLHCGGNEDVQHAPEEMTPSSAED